MKKYFSFACQLMLLVLAMVFSGGTAMAAEIGANGSDTDPNDGEPLDNATPDAQGKGIDQQGKGSTGSALTQAGQTLDDVDDYVSKFKAFNYAMHTDFLRKARQIKVDTKEPSNWEVGEGIIDCDTKSTTSESESADGTLSLYKNDVKLFKEGSTVIVDGVSGYDETGATQDGTPLMLYVTDITGSTVTVNAINGKKSGSEIVVPQIPGGSTLHVMAPALSESELEIAPDNAMPKETKVYLQKKVCSITITELFERIHKKAAWNAQDIRDWALHMFRRKCTRSMLISKGAKWIKPGGKRTGEEYCYTQEGVLRQLRLGYNIAKQPEFADLIGIQAALFTDNATTDEVDVYMGKYFTIGLLNIDFSKHPEMKFKEFTDGETGIEITSFKTNFGKLNFKYEHALDDLGYGQFAVAFNMAEAKRFYYKKQDKFTLNHNKGEGGEIREAKSEYYVQDDCLQLTGMNSMLIGPSTSLSNFKLSALEVNFTSVDKISTLTYNDVSVGDVVYLKVGDGTYPAGLYEVASIATDTHVITWKAYKSTIRA